MEPTRRDVIVQLDLLRGGLRLAVATLRKCKRQRPVNLDAVIEKLVQVRAEAKAVRECIRREEPKRIVRVR